MLFPESYLTEMGKQQMWLLKSEPLHYTRARPLNILEDNKLLSTCQGILN